MAYWKQDPGPCPVDDCPHTTCVADDGTGVIVRTPLGVIHTAIAYTDEAIHLFLAKKLTKSTAKLDAGEFLETLRVPYDDALAMIRERRISDCKTVAALLWFKALA